MKILGINGSPRKNSNTRFLLETALTAAEEQNLNIEIIDCYKTLKQLAIPFCIHCSSPCNKSCYRGSQLEENLEKMSEADAIILASPVYFGTVSAQLKAFWDKTRALRTDFKLMGKIGAAIAVGASMYGGQETTIRALQDMMFIQGMTIVGNGMYNVDVGHQGSCAHHSVLQNEKIITEVKNIGRRITYELLKGKT